MATLRTLAIPLAIAAVLVRFASATTYTFGGSNGGWDTSTNLQSLVFQNSPNHNGTEVSKPEYDSCLSTSPIQTSTSGSTTINLNSPGKRYFICAKPGHCFSGMKLQVYTLAAASISTSPESSPAPAGAPSHSIASRLIKKVIRPVTIPSEGSGRCTGIWHYQ